MKNTTKTAVRGLVAAACVLAIGTARADRVSFGLGISDGLGSFLALVVLFLLVVLVSCLFVDPKKLLEKPSGYFRFLLNEFCRIALALGGVHVNVTGLEKVPRKGRFLLVSNHRFAFDPIVFYAVMPWAELAREWGSFRSRRKQFHVGIPTSVPLSARRVYASRSPCAEAERQPRSVPNAAPRSK